MSLFVGRLFEERTGRAQRWVLSPLLFWTPLVLVVVHLAGGATLGGQTKEQCEKCCEGQVHDDYYLDQCKLKCFRTPDHCADQKAQKAPSQRPQALQRPTTPPGASQPSQPPTVAPEASQQQQQEMLFRWPDPLNLTPGKEAEAAGRIVELNGIAPQHPNYSRAVQSVAAVLIDFSRKNPQGGNLPTSRLARIIRQFR